MKKYFYATIVAFSLCLCAQLRAEEAAPAVTPGATPAEIEVHDDVNVLLVSDRGEPTTVLPILKGAVATEEKAAEPDRIEALFRYYLPRDFRNYDSWILEIKDPKRNLSYKLSTEGQMPPVLRWDGDFGDGVLLEPNTQYFYKLYLYFPDKTVASQWAVFTTFQRLPTEEKEDSGGLKITVSSTGGTHAMILATNRYRPTLFPNLYGELKLLIQDMHTVGFKFDSTSNIIYNAVPSRTGFFYSDLSFFYRIRIMGSPLRAPQIPITPPYVTSRYRAIPSSDVYGKPTSVEVGVRYFDTVLRGFGNEPIDSELARNISGVAGHVIASQMFGPFRVHAMAEYGKSFFRGDVSMLNFEGSLTYEFLESISPGLNFRYTMLNGTPAGDPYDGAPINGSPSPISNKILFGGVVIHFKL